MKCRWEERQEAVSPELKRQRLWDGQSIFQCPLCHLLAMEPPTSHFISVGLSFHIRKMRILIVCNLGQLLLTHRTRLIYVSHYYYYCFEIFHCIINTFGRQFILLYYNRPLFAGAQSILQLLGSVMRLYLHFTDGEAEVLCDNLSRSHVRISLLLLI